MMDNRDEYIVKVLARVVVIKKDNKIVQDNRKDYYLPITSELKDKRGELVLPRLTVQHRLATDREKEEHLRTGIVGAINGLAKWTNTKMPDLNGLPIMAQNDSDTYYLFDPDDTRPWLFDQQRANFREEGRVTFDTELDRPLRGATLVPADLHYKWASITDVK